MATILKRSEHFLRDVEQREDKKRKEGEREKTIFTTLLGKVANKLGQDSRNTMVDIMKRDCKVAVFSRIIEGTSYK